MVAQRARVIIKFKDGVNINTKTEEVLLLGASEIYSHPAINAITVVIPEDELATLNKDPDIMYIEITSAHDVHILGFEFPEAQVERVHAQDMAIPWNIAKIRAPDVWVSGNKGQNIKLCIIDTGIDYTHQNLKPNFKGGYNFVSRTDDPFDDNGHGSHVAGIAAAADISNGIMGVAPQASIYALKSLDSNGSGSYDNIIAAIQWAIDNSMQVINMSFGGSSFSQALLDICNAAFNKGILLVAAAGNSNGNPPSDTIIYPAKFDNVMAVASTDINDSRSSFSSTGPELNISAPGSNIISTVPKGSCNLCDVSGFKSLSGTSMATPHITGSAALLLNAEPVLKNTDVRTRLDNNAVDLGAPGKDPIFGFGRVDIKAAIDNTPPQPPTRFRCTGAPTFQCVQDPNGPYTSLQDCLAACKAPAVTMFDVRQIGSDPFTFGVIVTKNNTSGQYTADQACAKSCEIIKTVK